MKCCPSVETRSILNINKNIKPFIYYRLGEMESTIQPFIMYNRLLCHKRKTIISLKKYNYYSRSINVILLSFNVQSLFFMYS